MSIFKKSKDDQASVRASVRDSVWDSVGASVWDSVGASVYGQHDASWLAFYDFFRGITGLDAQTEKLAGLTAFAKSAGWAIPHEKICWISERTEIVNQDDRHRLHSIDGPAVRYPDGWEIYAVHGVRVPEFVIMRPDEIPEHIATEKNAEVRRVMIDRYPGGIAKYIADMGAEVVDTGKDDHPVKGLRGSRLLVKKIPDDETIVLIEMINSTPEHDGSVKKYHIRIDPNAYNGLAARDVWAAMASTWRHQDGSLFYENPEQYCPEVES